MLFEHVWTITSPALCQISHTSFCASNSTSLRSFCKTSVHLVITFLSNKSSTAAAAYSLQLSSCWFTTSPNIWMLGSCPIASEIAKPSAIRRLFQESATTTAATTRTPPPPPPPPQQQQQQKKHGFLQVLTSRRVLWKQQKWQDTTSQVSFTSTSDRRIHLEWAKEHCVNQDGESVWIKMKILQIGPATFSLGARVSIFLSRLYKCLASFRFKFVFLVKVSIKFKWSQKKTKQDSKVENQIGLKTGYYEDSCERIATNTFKYQII